MNILIVDDEVSIRKSLGYIINNEFGDKCHILTSNSAERALKTAQKNRIDLLISDICLGYHGAYAHQTGEKGYPGIRC